MKKNTLYINRLNYIKMGDYDRRKQPPEPKNYYESESESSDGESEEDEGDQRDYGGQKGGGRRRAQFLKHQNPQRQKRLQHQKYILQKQIVGLKEAYSQHQQQIREINIILNKLELKAENSTKLQALADVAEELRRLAAVAEVVTNAHEAKNPRKRPHKAENRRKRPRRELRELRELRVHGKQFVAPNKL
jgi:hypothetical protein